MQSQGPPFAHPLSMFGLCIPINEKISECYCLRAIFIPDITNPPMTMRHLFRLTGRRCTKGYEETDKEEKTIKKKMKPKSKSKKQFTNK